MPQKILDAILTALGRRLPADVAPTPQPAPALADQRLRLEFLLEALQIQEQLAKGQQPCELLAAAESLLARARAAGAAAYHEADYDLAWACLLLAQAYRETGAAAAALPLLDEAQQGFESIAREQGSEQVPGIAARMRIFRRRAKGTGRARQAQWMAADCFGARGACLYDLGRLDESPAAYMEAITRNERHNGGPGIAAGGKYGLGTVRLDQGRYDEALAAYAEARKIFTLFDQPDNVARVWYQTGEVYEESDNPKAAEKAYRKALAIRVRLDDRVGQARTLNQLGNLYQDALGRLKESVTCYQQAADLRVALGDLAGAGRVRNNLADALQRLGRFVEARREIERAIECQTPFGHAAEPWKAWTILADIEIAAGQPQAGPRRAPPSSPTGAMAASTTTRSARAPARSHSP